jgi:hypothetical protein
MRVPLVKTLFSTVTVTVVLLISACGGGSSSSDGGGDPPPEASIPQSIAGSYQGTWEGSGRDVSGVYTCEGTFNLTVTQSGSTVTVAFSVVSSSGSGTARCTEAFSFSGDGVYNANTGEVSILSTIGNVTAALSGTASELGGTISMSGNWSTTDAKSAGVIASGTWTAESL